MALRHVYPRRPHEYGKDRRTDGAGGYDWDTLLARLRAECRHFRNFDFRMALTECCVNTGVLQAIVERGYTAGDGSRVAFGGVDGTLPTIVRRISRPGGIACGGRRSSSLEIRPEGVLDAALALEQQGTVLCNKVAMVFAGHPPSAPREGRSLCHEERELLGRTNWIEVFLSRPDTVAKASAADLEVSALGDTYLEAGSSDVLSAENIWVLRDPETDGVPGVWRPEPHDLGAALCFLPQWQPPLAASAGAGKTPATTERGCAYRDSSDRVQYRAQVEAVLRVCMLLDCDGLVVGCAEGLCGSEVFGHPLREVTEVWGEALGPKAAQFRRIAFALGKDTPLNTRDTAGLLAETLGAHVVR